MRGLFYFRLAAVNIKKNGKAYLPYLLTCILTVAMYYIMKSLSLNEGLNSVHGAVASTLMLGSVVIAIFAFIFLFYTNSFLMKNRKKEFGLYQILGMEKKHLARVIACESLYISLLSLIGGLGAGMLLDKLMYLTVGRLIRVETPLDYYISVDSIRYTLVLFTVLFVLILLNSLRTVSFSKPIELLKGGNVGEKEPKVKGLAALLGLGCLGTGYYLAVTIENPVDALVLFFIAVILVIAGTYLLFMAGSIAFLKLLKKNKRYYYKPNHFIGVSGMIYRMKQNAVGLANICILSTMVLVMISSTSALMIGLEEILTQRYPYEFTVRCYDGEDESNAEHVMQTIFDRLEADGITRTDEILYTNFEITAAMGEYQSLTLITENDVTPTERIRILSFITAEDYGKFIGREIELGEKEVLLYERGRPIEGDEFSLTGEKYRVRERIDSFVHPSDLDAYIFSVYGVVVRDKAELDAIFARQSEQYGGNASVLCHYLQFNTPLSSEEQITLRETLRDTYFSLEEKGGYCRIECREYERADMYSLYGGFFFLGMFLGLLFIMAAVLIIYYKQVSEGYDDKERFQIMQKVGMSAREVKQTIRSQVLTVFFLPLLTAGVHVLFAFPMISRILTLFQLMNTGLYICCTVGCFLIFALIYAFIYFFTAKAYYKIVRR